MNTRVSGRQLAYEKASELHVGDLFNGTPAAPKRRKLKAKAPVIRPRKAAEVEPKIEPIKPPKHVSGLDCPCCGQKVVVPTVGIVIDHYKLTPLEAKILKVVWQGKGMPVRTERIFSAMYADDPDGGPTPTKMYLALKVALCHLRKKLKGSGVGVKNEGYRRGYRLEMGH